MNNASTVLTGTGNLSPQALGQRSKLWWPVIRAFHIVFKIIVTFATIAVAPFIGAVVVWGILGVLVVNSIASIWRDSAQE